MFLLLLALSLFDRADYVLSVSRTPTKTIAVLPDMVGTWDLSWMKNDHICGTVEVKKVPKGYETTWRYVPFSDDSDKTHRVYWRGLMMQKGKVLVERRFWWNLDIWGGQLPDKDSSIVANWVWDSRTEEFRLYNEDGRFYWRLRKLHKAPLEIE